MTDNASAKSGGSFITALFATTIPTSPYLVGLAQREEKARPIVSQYGASRMSKFAALRDSCLMLGFCVVMAIASSAQTYAVLFSFDGMNGAYPDTGLIQATNGNFYGVTYGGGAPSGGTVFEITPGGVMTVLYSFCSQPSCSDSSGPLGGLIQATDGNFYGTTWGGGSASNCGSPLGCGTIFRITSGGVLTSLYSFCSQPDCADGADPTSLIQATDGNLYGITTYAGGAHDSGTVFQMTLAGTLTTLHRFHGVDGATPGALIQATDGNLYGVATTSGTNGHGTVFRITPGGSLTTVYSFCAQTKCADGADPSSLIQARDGNLYGTTTGGGTLNHGTVYQITQGALTTLHSFVGSQGVGPEALMQAADGNFYGMTARGGPTGDGTIFEIGAGGALATLYNFCSQSGCPEGGFPSRLIQATGGSFYGTTGNGGAYNYGTVFTFGPPSGCPFENVAELRRSGSQRDRCGQDGDIDKQRHGPADL